MAQWVPKTAWRISNLNKLYGVGEIGLNTAQRDFKPGVRHTTPFFAAPFRPVPAAIQMQQQQQQQQQQDQTGNDFAELRKMLKEAYNSHVPFIDIRDSYETTQQPLKKAVQLHHHDLLSGAANEILPADRKNAQMVVVASNPQRALNGFKALRRWGFESVMVADAEAVAGLDEE